MLLLDNVIIGEKSEKRRVKEIHQPPPPAPSSKFAANNLESRLDKKGPNRKCSRSTSFRSFFRGKLNQKICGPRKQVL